MKNPSGKNLFVLMALRDHITIIREYLSRRKYSLEIMRVTLVGILVRNLTFYRHSEKRIRANALKFKFLIGMSLECLTMVVAGSVKIFRPHHCPQRTRIIDESLHSSVFQSV